MEGNEGLFTTYSMVLMIPSITGAAAFPFVFCLLENKGRTASLFAAGTGVCVLALYFFSPVTAPVPFYACATLSQLFFCGFNTAIYAIVPDSVGLPGQSGAECGGSRRHPPRVLYDSRRAVDRHGDCVDLLPDQQKLLSAHY